MKKPRYFFEVSHAASLCLASWLSVLRQHGGKCGMWVRQSLTVRSIGCHLMSCMTWYDMVVLFQTGMQELQSTQTMLWMLHRCDISSLNMKLHRSLLDHLRAEMLHLQCTCLIEKTFTMQFVCTHLTPTSKQTRGGQYILWTVMPEILL